MKIYRVAETKKNLEDAYEEVDKRDLSSDSEGWVLDSKGWFLEKKVEEINITKLGYERQALIRIVFSEKDIFALYEGLIKSQQEKLSDCKNLKAENDKLKKDIGSLWKARSAAGEALRTATRNGASKFEIVNLESIISVIDSIKQN